MAGIWILIIHIFFVVLFFFLWRMQILKVQGTALIFLCCMPVWGEIVILLMDRHARQPAQAKHKELQYIRSDEMAESGFRQEREDNDSNVVPLEDALLLNDADARRSAMLNVLMDDSGNYMRAIRQARKNDDSEVVHYATTAMTEISGRYEERLQIADRNYQREPDSDAALDAYIEILEQYLEDEIAEGELLEIQRHQYQKLLRIRAGKKQNREDYAALAASYMDSGLYEKADEVIGILERRWMKWEVTLRLRMRYLFSLHRGEEMHRLIRKVREEEYLPQQIQEELRFWEG